MKRVNRRRFLRQTAQAAAAAAAVGRVPLLRGFGQGSPSDTVRLGIIGFGVQGLTDANSALRVPNVSVVAAASCYDGHLERARELLGDASLRTRDYRRLLDSRDVDAVVVSTPDHWHTRICLDALDAGKDIYCEKPLTHMLPQGDELAAAVARSRQILQVGSQHTSTPAIIEARDVIASGLIGQVTQVKATWDTNSDISAWVKPIPPNASLQTIDWERFQGTAPRHDFDPRRVFRWRTYREYGEGLAGDVLVHLITTVQFILNLQAPVVANAIGGRLFWKDDRNVYDTIVANYEWPEGIIGTFGATQNNHYDDTGIRILGTKGTMVLTFTGYTVYSENDESNWRYTTNVWPKDLREEYWRSKGLPLNPDPNASPVQRPERRVLKQYEPPQPSGRRRAYHMEHFIDCVRARRRPVQDVDMGNNAAIAAHLANMSYYHKVTVQFDRATRQVTPAVDPA